VNIRRVARSWLIWLALILPIGQALAGVHALSHAVERGNDGLVHRAVCDLCLVAANLGAGAPAAGPQPLPVGPVVHAAPLEPGLGAPGLGAVQLPQARAPPASV
jgi:hypothetical protein